MMDVVSSKKRSQMMAGIHARNTKPEIAIRRLLHKSGFRFRIHNDELPGKPDIVLKKYRAIIFVHGCFWHRHQCHLFKWPKTRAEFWKTKINRNVLNDKKAIRDLHIADWRICVVWECSVKGTKKKSSSHMEKLIKNWLDSNKNMVEISG